MCLVFRSFALVLQFTGRCTTESCGVKREWVGVPRKRTKDGKVDCVCIDPKDPLFHDEMFSLYPDCDPLSPLCYTEPTQPNPPTP